MNVVTYLRDRAQQIHWYRSNAENIVACGRAVQSCSSVEHTPEGFIALADGQPGYCVRCCDIAFFYVERTRKKKEEGFPSPPLPGFTAEPPGLAEGPPDTRN